MSMQTSTTKTKNLKKKGTLSYSSLFLVFWSQRKSLILVIWNVQCIYINLHYKALSLNSEFRLDWTDVNALSCIKKKKRKTSELLLFTHYTKVYVEVFNLIFHLRTSIASSLLISFFKQA